LIEIFGSIFEKPLIMKKITLSELLEELNFNTNLEETNEVVPEDILDQSKHHLLIINEIEESLKTTPLNKSAFAKQLFHFNYLLENSGITEENYKEVVSNDENQYFLGLYYSFKNKVLVKDFEIKYKKLVAFSINYFKEKDKGKIITINPDQIFSVYFDYMIIKELKSIFLSIKPEIKNEFTEIYTNLLSSLNNAASLMNEDLDSFNSKKGTLYGNNNNYKSIMLNKDIIELFRKNLEPYNILNSTVFSNSITDKFLIKLIFYIENFQISDLDNEIFNRLNYTFTEDTELSTYKKNLFIHELLLEFFLHPKAINLIKDEPIFKNRTKNEIEKNKISIVKSIIGSK
jgi:hypothetical protein